MFRHFLKMKENTADTYATYPRSYLRRHPPRSVIRSGLTEEIENLEGTGYPAILIATPFNKENNLSRATPNNPPPFGSTASTIHPAQLAFFALGVALIPANVKENRAVRTCIKHANITAFVEQPIQLSKDIARHLQGTRSFINWDLNTTYRDIKNLILTTYLGPQTAVRPTNEQPTINDWTRKLHAALRSAQKGIEPLGEFTTGCRRPDPQPTVLAALQKDPAQPNSISDCSIRPN